MARTGIGNIRIKNIYYMLAYVCDTLTPSVYADMQGEHFQNVYNLFASVLSRRIPAQRKRGLYKAYRSRTEEMTVVRGKLDLPGTIRCRLRCRNTVVCVTDELSEDNLLNQILKSTMLLLLKRPDVDVVYKARLQKELLYFSNVKNIPDLEAIAWDRIQLYRHNQNYRLLLGICRYIVAETLLTTQKGRQRSFTLEEANPARGDMDELFEQFVRKYYQQEYRHCLGFAARDEWMEWQGDNRRARWLPKMHTDITLTYGQKVLILDTKYYKVTPVLKQSAGAGSRHVHEDDLYQMFAYVKNRERIAAPDGKLPEAVEGIILYARTQETERPNERYDLAGSHIRVTTLDLDTDFSQICRQLDAIVCEYFGPELARERKRDERDGSRPA